MPIDVSIIIVTYNSQRHLLPCLDSIQAMATGVRYEIILVDNGSADGSIEEAQRRYPSLKVIRNADNRGFGAANNQGADTAEGEFLLLLNADTVFLDHGLSESLAFARRNNLAILGPRMEGAEGEEQVTWEYENRLGRYIRNIYRLALIPSKFRKKDASAINGPVDVGFLVGAAMLINRKDVKKLGLFDERFFFNCEERDLCLRYVRAGRRLVYYPGWRIIHYGGSGVRHSRFHTVEWIRASEQFAEKHGGRLSVCLIRVGFLALLVSSTLLHRLRGIRGDAVSADAADAYAGVLKWLLKRPLVQ